MHGHTLDRKLFGGTYEQPYRNEAKGRSKELLEKRNLAIYYRYYAYSITQQKMSYEAKIAALCQEFFLSQAMIIKILSAGSDRILTIKKEKPGIKEIQAMFPFYNWQLKMD